MSTYKEAGVDIEAGDKFVDYIKTLPSVSSVGSFGAVIDPKQIGLKDPLTVMGTDGVGTKLRIAHLAGKYDTIGVDLVAMCVNDILCHGAKTFHFLDYYACGKIASDKSREILKGIAKGCEISGCNLVGGETAEMPLLYKEDDFDLAGFGVGYVERNDFLPRAVSQGDNIIAVPSSGLHSNGYSLVNSLIESGKIDYQPILDDLLTPTQIYVQDLLPLVSNHHIHGFANITGGGLEGNISRIIPNSMKCEIDYSLIKTPEIFHAIQSAGGIQASEMYRVFNMGVGFVIIASPEFDFSHYGYKIGTVS